MGRKPRTIFTERSGVPLGVNDKLMQYIRRKEIDRRLESHETFRHVGGTGYGILRVLWILDAAYLFFICGGYLLLAVTRLAS